MSSPICFENLSESSLDETVFCVAMCGNNIHKQCFDQWARSKRHDGAAVTCGNLVQDQANRISLLPVEMEGG